MGNHMDHKLFFLQINLWGEGCWRAWLSKEIITNHFRTFPARHGPEPTWCPAREIPTGPSGNSLWYLLYP